MASGSFPAAMAQVCIQVCSCSVSPRVRAATPRQVRATLSSSQGPSNWKMRELGPGSHQLCSSMCCVGRKTPNSTEARRGRQKAPLCTTLAGGLTWRGNAPCLRPHIHVGHVFLQHWQQERALLTQHSQLPWTTRISYSPEETQQGKIIGE